MNEYQSQIGILNINAQEDLSRKASLILELDFEAAVRLKAQKDLIQLVKLFGLCSIFQQYDIV